MGGDGVFGNLDGHLMSHDEWEWRKIARKRMWYGTVSETVVVVPAPDPGFSEPAISSATADSSLLTADQTCWTADGVSLCG